MLPRRGAHAIDFAARAPQGYAFQVELTYRALRAGLRVVELPIVFRERREGESKMSGAIALEAAWRVPALRAPVAARSQCRSERVMKLEQLALVRGWADTRATLRALAAAPARRRRRLGAGASRVAALLLPPRGCRAR